MNVSVSVCTRVYPRVHVKLKITNIDAKTKDLFLVQNNIYGNGNHSGFIVAS